MICEICGRTIGEDKGDCFNPGSEECIFQGFCQVIKAAEKELVEAGYTPGLKRLRQRKEELLKVLDKPLMSRSSFGE